MEAQQSLITQVVDAVRSVVGPGPVPLHRPFITKDDAARVADTVREDAVGYGAIQAFEDHLAALCDVRYVVAVSSGTAALHLALLACGTREGEHVPVPTMTFAAAAAAVRYCGAVPSFGARGRLPSSPASIFVHLLGAPDTRLLNDRPRGVVIEDAAEALGSVWGGRPAGSLGDIGVLSFNANKIVTTGTGGAVLTNSESAAIRIRHLATTAKLSSPFEFKHDDVGFNYRMGNINAAMGLGQLDRLPETLRRKRATAEAYRAAFWDMPGVQYVVQPEGSNNWLNRIIVPAELRLPIMEALRAEGVESRALFTPLPLLEPYADFPRDRDELEFAMDAHAQSICLPSGAM